MRLFLRFGAVLGSALALGALGLAQNPGRNAFLDTSVRTTDQLIVQVKTDRKIRDSYLRHFAMNEAELYTYLRTLRPMRLQQEGIYSIYSVPPNGELTSHTQRMRKGELVFVDRSGKPVLRARCGNPMGHPDMPDAIPESALNIPPSEMREIPAPYSESVPIALVALQPLAPIVPELLVETPPTPQPIIEERAQSFPLLPLLALPAVGAAFNGGSGGDTPVPEPMTMLSLAIGAGVLALRRKRASK